MELKEIIIELSKTQKYLDWLKFKLYLDSIAKNSIKRIIKRGQVYWCNFGINIGSEMSKATPRPCVIIQNDVANKASPNTIVCPITHDASCLPCIIPIKTIRDNTGNIILDGNVNVSNIICISKARLGNIIISNKLSEIKDIECAIAKQLELIGYYNDIKTKLDKQNDYLNKVKTDRNNAEDFIITLKQKLNVSTKEEIIKTIDDLLDK